MLTVESSKERALQNPHDDIDGPPSSANHRLARRVLDQDFNSRLIPDRRAHRLRRTRHDAGDPVHRLTRRDPPHSPRGIAGARKLGLKEWRRLAAAAASRRDDSRLPTPRVQPFLPGCSQSRRQAPRPDRAAHRSQNSPAKRCPESARGGRQTQAVHHRPTRPAGRADRGEIRSQRLGHEAPPATRLTTAAHSRELVPQPRVNKRHPLRSSGNRLAKVDPVNVSTSLRPDVGVAQDPLLSLTQKPLERAGSICNHRQPMRQPMIAATARPPLSRQLIDATRRCTASKGRKLPDLLDETISIVRLESRTVPAARRRTGAGRRSRALKRCRQRPAGVTFEFLEDDELAQFRRGSRRQPRPAAGLRPGSSTRTANPRAERPRWDRARISGPLRAIHQPGNDLFAQTQRRLGDRRQPRGRPAAPRSPAIEPRANESSGAGLRAFLNQPRGQRSTDRRAQPSTPTRRRGNRRNLRRLPQHSINAIAVAPRVFEPFQHQRDGTVARQNGVPVRPA